MSSIYGFVKKQCNNYRSDAVEITPGHEFSQYKTLRTIELCHNSRFTTGNKDSLDRERPLYNICKFRVNVATRATDLDTKGVQIESERVTKTSYAESFLLNLKNRNWMKKMLRPLSQSARLNALQVRRCPREENRERR